MSIFLFKLLELSLQAGALTIAILLVRLIFRKLPARYLCILWMIVGVRLVIPFSFETGFAIMPSLESLLGHEDGKMRGVLVEYSASDEEGNLLWQVNGEEINKEADYYIGSVGSSGNEVDYFITVVDGQVSTVKESEMYQDAPALSDETEHYIVTASPTPVPEGIGTMISKLGWREIMTSVMPVLFVLWVLGVSLLLAYGVYNCLKVKRLVRNSIHYEENIWLCENVKTPFLFGWLHPQIYLPTNLEETQMDYVILHEKTHIARGDNYSKIAGYVLLSVYWFNPLIWLAYVLFCKDVERACDERALGGLDGVGRKGYAEALLECSVDHHFAVSNPLAFGETDVKKRITGILNYKKPGKWLAVIAVLLCLVAVVGCFSVQQEENEPETPAITKMPTPVPTTEPMVKPQNGKEEELLGKTTPETLVAVPVGQTVQVDLDGDGAEDTVTFGLEGYEGSASYNEVIGDIWYETEDNLEHFFLQINENTFFKGEDRKFWDASPHCTSYYIFDIDVTDGYKEIGLCSSGPNANSVVQLYRYDGGKLQEIGGFISAPLESEKNPHSYEKMPYEEMVAQVDRENFLITVPGDGTILCEEHAHLLETTSVVNEYRLADAESGTEARLEKSLREHYEFLDWMTDRGENYERTAAVSFGAWSTASMNSDERVVVPEGSAVTFYDYYPLNEWGDGWVRFFYTVEEKWDSEAWIYVEDGNVWIAVGKEKPENLFKNLSQAG